MVQLCSFQLNSLGVFVCSCFLPSAVLAGVFCSPPPVRTHLVHTLFHFSFPRGFSILAARRLSPIFLQPTFSRVWIYVCLGDPFGESHCGIRGDVQQEKVPRPEFEGNPYDQEVSREGIWYTYTYMHVVAHSRLTHNDMDY